MRPRRLTAAKEAEVVGAYVSGESIEVLAKRYGFANMGLWRLLQRQGVKCRRAQETRGLRKAGVVELPLYLLLYRPPPDFHTPSCPPVAALIPGKLAIVVIDQERWDVDSIQAAQGIPHADARRVIQIHQTQLIQKVPQTLFLWKDELKSPGLQRMIEHRTGNAASICSARQTEVVKLTAAEANAFYVVNHLQGRCNGKFHYALRYKGDTVAAMSFADARACRGPADTALLQRFAVAGSVPGAASRLLAAFRQEHSGPVVSYSDERYAPRGRLYETLGFTSAPIESPDYRYWRDNRWYAKNQKQRKHLIAELATRGEAPTPEDTEFTMARRLGYKRCYDCGKRTWLLDNAAPPLLSPT